MIIPRFAINTVEGTQASTGNAKLAATICAFDVPLHPSMPWDTQAGDGIQGVRITFNFEAPQDGNSPKEIIQKWHDQKWKALNPDNPLTKCYDAFLILDRMVSCAKSKTGFPIHKGASVKVQNNRHAAILAAMGHPIMGWTWHGDTAIWHFHECTGADMALIADARLYEKLPDADISYVKGAVLGHEAILKKCTEIRQARIEHKGRIIIIGKDIPKNLLDSLEKIAYRK
jgi:hypothetical protein